MQRWPLVQYWAEWVHQEQALLAGLLASCAALITVIYLRKQIELQRKELGDRIDREERRARARLPIALSILMGYSGECRQIIFEVANSLPKDDDGRWAIGEAEIPRLPHDALNVVCDAIFSANGENARKLTHIVTNAQVFSSRMQRYVESFCVSDARGLRSETVERLYDAYVFEAVVEKAFAYARFEADFVGDFQETPQTRLWMMDAPLIDELSVQLKRRWPPKVMPTE